MKNKYLLYILLVFNSITEIKAQINSSIPPPPSVNLNFTGLCAGKSELFTATPINGGLTPFYTWKRNNIIVPIFGNKTTDNGLGANRVNEVFVAGNNIYAATTGGLSISTNAGSTFSNKTKIANGLGNDAVNGLFVSSTKIYAATGTGLSISEDNGNTFINRTITNGLGSNIINDVFVDATGNKIYAATNGGLSISIDAGVSFVNNTTSSVRGIFVAGSTIYAATTTGLDISTDGGSNFTTKTSVNGLGSNNINDVLKVGNILYVATSGGLSISSDNGNSFSNKTTTNGLADNNVSSVFAIGSFIYASTNSGLSLSNNNGNAFFISQTTSDGLGTNIVTDAFALGNKIYTATTGGLAIATIDRIQVNNAIANDVYSVTMLPSIEVSSSTVSKTLTIYPLPIPNIITNSPVCTAMPLNLNSSNERISTGNTYAWTGPNVYSSTNQNLSFLEATVVLSGTYSITITDANGCTATTSAPVIVNPLPIPSVSNNSPICTAFTLNLSAANTRNLEGNNFSWTGPNSYISNNQNPSFPNATVSLSGTYSVTITDANGCTATSSTYALVHPLPIPTSANNSPICAGFTLNLSATNTRDLEGNLFSWTGPNAYSSSNQFPIISDATVSLSGNYSITVTDLHGCTATSSTYALVHPLPIPTSANNSPICSGFTLNLSAANTRDLEGNFYAWTGPNAYSSSNQNPSLSNATTSLSGNYSVTVTDLHGCTVTTSTPVLIKPIPLVPIIIVPTQSVVCTPNTLSLTASACSGTITWSDNSTGTIITVSAVGIYSLSAICTIDGCLSGASLAVNLEIKPTPTAQASNTGPYLVGQTIELTASLGANYSWTGPSGTPPDNFTSNIASPSIPNALLANGGIYSVVVSTVGCSATATTNVIVTGIDPCNLSRIIDYYYVKAGNEHPVLFPLTNGMVIQQIPEQTTITFIPVCQSKPIRSMLYQLQGPEINWSTVENENEEPFTLFNSIINNSGRYYQGKNLLPGTYFLTITGYSELLEQGEKFGPIIITFTIVGTLSTISMPTMPTQNLCAGSNIDVSFTTFGNFNALNEFKVQLSDANGTFQNPINIGSANAAGTVTCTIPQNTLESSKYLIRVASSTQITIGNPTMNFITIKPLYGNISQTIDAGTTTRKAVRTITASNNVISPAKVTYQAGNAIMLNAGFSAGNGSVFKAEIKTCTN